VLYEGRSKSFESDYLPQHVWMENVTELTYVVLLVF